MKNFHMLNRNVHCVFLYIDIKFEPSFEKLQRIDECSVCLREYPLPSNEMPEVVISKYNSNVIKLSNPETFQYERKIHRKQSQHIVSC